MSFDRSWVLLEDSTINVWSHAVFITWSQSVWAQTGFTTFSSA